MPTLIAFRLTLVEIFSKSVPNILKLFLKRDQSIIETS